MVKGAKVTSRGGLRHSQATSQSFASVAIVWTISDRQAGADEVVQELTDAIGQTRDALDAVVDTVRPGRLPLLVRRSGRNDSAAPALQQRDEHRATLFP